MAEGSLWLTNWNAWAGVPASPVEGVAALLAGLVLGVTFFAGLWWTVRRGAASSVPLRWFLGSLVLRTAVVLAGFYAVGAGHPVRLGLCLLGFVLARTIVLRATRPAATATATATATASASASSTASASAAVTSGTPPCA